MNFSDHMNGWLYEDGGYYSKFHEIGKKGDFFTAVSSSQFFGGAIAKQIISTIESTFLSKNAVVVEIGAHKGYLLADIIQFIYTLKPKLLDTLKFAIIERQDAVREEQERYMRDSFGDAIDIDYYASLDDFRADEAFFIANEIFDAFACELIYKGKIATVESHAIEFNKDSKEILRLAKKYNKERGEIAVGYEAFAERMFKAAKRFDFITFDYGDLLARPDFSIRIYKSHKVYPLFEDGINLEELYGSSDITYDVNFSHVIDAFEEQGVRKIAYKTQLVALIDFGILELLEMVKERVSGDVYRQELEKVKSLISPSFMGERFKMVHFRRE